MGTSLALPRGRTNPSSRLRATGGHAAKTGVRLTAGLSVQGGSRDFLERAFAAPCQPSPPEPLPIGNGRPAARRAHDPAGRCARPGGGANPIAWPDQGHRPSQALPAPHLPTVRGHAWARAARPAQRPRTRCRPGTATPQSSGCLGCSGAANGLGLPPLALSGCRRHFRGKTGFCAARRPYCFL